MSEIVIDEDSGTLTITDCTITFPYGFHPNTRVGTIVITPAGGVASFPIATQGSSGLPPIIDFEVHPVPHGDPLPSPNPTTTVIDPGGPGEAAHYKFDAYLPMGKDGEPGEFNFLSAADLIDASDLDELSDGFILSYVNDGENTPGVKFIPQKRCDIGVPGAFDATGWSNISPRILTSVTLQPKPFPRRVLVAGGCGVVGSADTRVDLVARLGNPNTGFEVGRAFGMVGAAPPRLVLESAPPAGSDLTDPSTYVAAGQATVVHLSAEQQAATSNSWSTTPGRFAVYELPI